MPSIIEGTGFVRRRMDVNERRRLVVQLAVSAALVAAVTSVVVRLTGPVVHGWDDTVGFVAGILTACLCIAVVLRGTAAPSPPG